jgi:uncharacterized protein YecE (DUF72 family)
VLLDPRLYLGTSSWSSKDWEGVFYPEGTPPGEYLAYYATRHRTVEVDATFYRAPSAAMTRKWRDALPEGFVLAAKVPRTITHDKTLTGCEEEMEEFLSAMDNLGDRLGPMLFQFPYHNKASEITRKVFTTRLRSFLPKLPKDHRFAIEIRNKGWVVPELLDLLREHEVAFALIDHPWMPRVDQLMADVDPITTGFAYVRWLGDRKGIEERTKSWDKVIVDRTSEMERWVPAIRELLKRNVTVYGYFNNHYAGHAPDSIALFEKVWQDAI